MIIHKHIIKIYLLWRKEIWKNFLRLQMTGWLMMWIGTAKVLMYGVSLSGGFLAKMASMETNIT
jgi:hypothetical protein